MNYRLCVCIHKLGTLQHDETVLTCVCVKCDHISVGCDMILSTEPMCTQNTADKYHIGNVCEHGTCWKASFVFSDHKSADISETLKGIGLCAGIVYLNCGTS